MWISGGGTTGLALLKDGKVVEIADEPTGGTHLTLVLSGNYHIPFAEAEAIKQDYSRHSGDPSDSETGYRENGNDRKEKHRFKKCGYHFLSVWR